MNTQEQRLEFVVPSVLTGERIDRLIALEADRSRATVGRAISEGFVTCNGIATTTRSQRVNEGDRVVAVLPPRRSILPRANSDVRVNIVHEDPDFWVIEKQIGLVVHPGAGHVDDTLANGLLALDPSVADVGSPARPGIVHRLDRDTSGLLVAARTPAAYESLTVALQDRRMAREYRVIVDGWTENARGIIDVPIGRSMRNPKRMTVAADGKEARTTYWREVVYGEPRPATLLGCKLDTGRTHQIRVHLQAIKVPVIGDAKYGKVNVLGARRPMLHSFRLAFPHPVTGLEMDFESTPPEDFRAVLDQLTEV
ncbi:MAG: RluA family pseudouridine synthase [Acidimicrobiales bacterium]